MSEKLGIFCVLEQKEKYQILKETMKKGESPEECLARTVGSENSAPFSWKARGILILVREIIYSIYYSRVKKAEMLDMQISLLRTNIESLEAGRGNKKVIARQKKIAEKLEKMKNKISLKMDTAELGAKQQKIKEARELHIDRNSPIMQDAMSSTGDGGTILI